MQTVHTARSYNHNSLVLVDMEGDEGEHAGVDEEHHEDGAQEPDELGLPTPKKARAEIYQT